MNSIESVSMDVTQDFSALRKQAHEALQKKVGQTWTDFNDSDPGVTVLDQILYALTELGYCTHFSIEDILASVDGNINAERQFFSRESILSSSAISTPDYIKLLETIDGVRNARFVNWNGALVPYLVVDDEPREEDVIQQSRRLLAKNRNIGELIALPQALSAYFIDMGRSSIVVNQAQDVAQIRQKLQSVLGALGTVEVPGVSVDTLTGAISGITGVTATSIQLPADMAASDIPIGCFPVYIGIEEMSIQVDQDAKRHAPENSGDDASTEMLALNSAFPHGRWRDIANYYSIQNTFPNQYSIGRNESSGNWPKYRLAQISQLKGYLLAFDQVLANQFAQLANVSTLFSFEASATHDLPPTSVFSGLPIREFTPTYFSQTLYDVPGVQPLLSGSELMDFRFGDQDNAAKNAWMRYCNDPFNPYDVGLREATETEPALLLRREQMLDHLLARHGVGAEDIDCFLHSPRWPGPMIVTRVMIKTVLMQNYQTLSFHRTKARNIMDGQRVGTPGRYRLLPNVMPQFGEILEDDRQLGAMTEVINRGYPSVAALTSEVKRLLSVSPDQQKQIQALIVDGNGVPSDFYRESVLRDGVVDVALTTRLHEISNTELQRFSTFEIEADIRLGLRHELALVRQRMLSLLLDKASLVWTLNAAPGARHSLPESGLAIQRTASYDTITVEGEPVAVIEKCKSSWPASYQHHLDQLQWFLDDSRGLILVEEALLIGAQAQKQTPGITDEYLPYWLNSLTLITVFPAWVSFFSSTQFAEDWCRITQLLLPAHLQVKPMKLLPFTYAADVIGKYCAFYNAFSGTPNQAAQAAAIGLATLLEDAP